MAAPAGGNGQVPSNFTDQMYRSGAQQATPENVKNSGMSFADFIKTNGPNGKGGDLPFGIPKGIVDNFGNPAVGGNGQVPSRFTDQMYRGGQRGTGMGDESSAGWKNRVGKKMYYDNGGAGTLEYDRDVMRDMQAKGITPRHLDGQPLSPNRARPMPMPFPPQGGPAYPMPQPQTGFNINTAAAQGLQGAMATTAAETGYRPMQVNPAMVAQKGYNPSIMDGVNPITANNVTGTGYDASTIGDVRTVSADNVQAGQLAGSDLSAYTNPYETQVVDQALGDIERNRLMAQNVGSAQAGAANAFGGSRQGIAEAETNRAYMEQAAKTASGLRQAGYMNAQEQSGQDIARRMQASLANQQANMQAGQFNANTDLQSQQANQSAFNQAGQFGASALNQGNLANQSANMQAQQASASNALAAQQANQAARNNAGQFGANAFNQAGQLNQSAMMQARLANQNAGLSGSQQRLNAGQQLGNLSNLGFGMGQQIQGRMDQQGAAQQNLQQQIINAAKGQYGGFTGAPNQSLQALLAAVGGAPAVGSQTSGYTPGLFDYLSLGAGMAR